MYQVVRCNYNDFTEKEQEEWCHSDNGCGKEYASYIVEKENGKIIDVHSDAMEPEDVSFYRELNWISDSLERAYMLGINSKT